MIGWITLILATFGLSISITFLHVGYPLRLLVSGMADKDFRRAVKSSSFSGFRQRVLARWIRCPACVGYWVGMGLSMWWWPEQLLVWRGLADAACAGLVTCAANFIIWVVMLRLGADKL